MLQKAHKLSDYIFSDSEVVVKFHISSIILNLHFDATHLSAGQERIRSGGYFFLGDMPQNEEPMQLNINLHTICAILKLVISSAAETEVIALFSTHKKSEW